MSKKYTPQQVQTLQAYIKEHPFTEEELKSLTEGTGTIKVEYRADKVLFNHETWMGKAISRNEALQRFAARQDVIQDLSMLGWKLDVLLKTLKSTGALSVELLQQTEQNMTAEIMPNLCDNCVHISLSECEGFPKFSGEILPELTGALADKVIECKQFERPKIEGQC